MIRRLGISLLVVTGFWMAGHAQLAGTPLPSSTEEITQTTAPSVSSTDSDPPLLGVVWAPPNARGPTLRALSRLKKAGVQALRLLRLPPTGTRQVLFGRADSLDLTLFVDLPVSYTAARALEDSLKAAQPALSRLQQQAQRHESIHAVGLARGANTTSSLACNVLRQWTQRIHDSSSLRTYYVSPFSGSADRCGNSVDLPLLDTRGVNSPLQHRTSWADAAPAPGIGALGTWTAPQAASGLLTPHSAEQQARYLERALRAVTDSVAASPPVFIYRWQDREPPLLNTRRYGLHTRSGTARPAASVVEGFYTGVQRVFAFPSGAPPSTAPHTFVLIGWGLLALLGGLYARNPYVRETAFRYFVAHGFYRDALEKGRGVDSGVNLLLLLTVSVSIGMTTALFAGLIATQPSAVFLLEALPPVLRGPLADALAQPALAGIAIGTLSLLLLGFWTGALILTAHSESPFSAAQGLMLIVWPCWPALGGMLLALMAATAPPVPPTALGLLLLGLGLGALLTVTTRILLDFRAAAGVSLIKTIALLLPSPFVIVVGAAILTVLRYSLPLSLLWQLAVHT